jgi:hypothetical protein
MRNAFYATELDMTLKRVGYTLILAFKEKLDIIRHYWCEEQSR